MEIFPNPLLAAVLVVPFCATFALLYVILLKPLVEYLVSREHEVTHARHEAHVFESHIASKTGELEQRLVETRDAVAQQRNAARARAQAAEQQILSEARHKAEAEVKSALSAIAQDVSIARSALQQSATALGSDITQQVLSREVSA